MSQSPATKEPQYSLLFDVKEKHGIARLGLMVNESWNQDPKRTLFTLARYKFVARMLSGRRHVLEVGCADAFGTRIVQQAVGKVTATDFDPLFIEDIKERMNSSLADRGVRPRHAEGSRARTVRCRLCARCPRTHPGEGRRQVHREHDCLSEPGGYCHFRNAITRVRRLTRHPRARLAT